VQALQSFCFSSKAKPSVPTAEAFPSRASPNLSAIEPIWSLLVFHFRRSWFSRRTSRAPPKDRISYLNQFRFRGISTYHSQSPLLSASDQRRFQSYWIPWQIDLPKTWHQSMNRLHILHELPHLPQKSSQIGASDIFVITPTVAVIPWLVQIRAYYFTHLCLKRPKTSKLALGSLTWLSHIRPQEYPWSSCGSLPLSETYFIQNWYSNSSKFIRTINPPRLHWRLWLIERDYIISASGWYTARRSESCALEAWLKLT